MDNHGLRAGPAALWFLGPLIALAIWYVYGSLVWVVFHSGQFQGAFSVHALNLIALVYAGIAIWFIAREPWGVLERAFWFSLPASVPLGLIGLVALLIGAVLSIADKPSAGDTLKTGFAAICGALLSILVLWLAGFMVWPRHPTARATAEKLSRERARRAANSTGAAPPKNRGAVGKRDELGGATEHRTGAKPRPEIQVDDPDADKAVQRALDRLWAGDIKGAQRRCRPVAEAGHRAAAYLLGGVIAGTFPDDAARAWWRKATADVQPEQMRRMGLLLGWDSETVDREYRLRVRVLRGDARATYRLGCLVMERGDQEQADSLFAETRRLAAELGDPLTESRALARQQDYAYDEEGAYRQARRQLKQAAERGEPDARFLLGHIYKLMRREDDAERNYQLAAEAGHAPAMAAMGDLRTGAGDQGGAEFWLRRAAEAGHPEAALTLAKWVDGLSLDEQRRWAERAFRSGHPAAAFPLCRVIKRTAKPRDTSGKETRKPKSPPEATTSPDPSLASRQILAADVLSSWDELIKEVPEEALPVEYLSQRTGLARRAVDALRHVRNQCAHPAERGLPDAYELDVALATAYELRRRLARKADETG